MDQLSSMSQKETRESAPEPINDQLPKNISACPILSSIAPDPRGSRSSKKRWRVDIEPDSVPQLERCGLRRGVKEQRPNAEASDERVENMASDKKVEF